MKFLGEFIQHFVSRFRNDIFLEDVSSGTIASGGYLGVDSNNKIVKASTVGSSVDLTSEVTGVLPVSNGGTGASTLASDSVLTGNGTSAVQAETHLTWSASTETLSVEGESSSKPIVKIQNNNTDATPGELKFRKLSNVADGDHLGKITFVGFAPSGSPTDVEFATILGEVNEADDGDEEGKLTLSVASHDGESQPGVTIVSGNAEDEVDVTIANGATSLTTIAGSLTVTSDLTVSGTTTTIDTTNLNVEDKNITLNYNASSDTSSSADGAGITIQDAVDASNDATILWTAASDTFTFSHAVNATIATATQGTIDHDSLANFVAAEHYAWASDISSTATIHTNNINDLHGAGVNGAANQLLTDDGDGTVTSQSNVKYNSTANLFDIQSGTSQRPILSITNANEDAEAPELHFRKAAGLAADGDDLGKIEFRGSDTDNTGNDAIFAQIVGEVQEADNNSEEGKLTLNVASHDQELQPGLIIASGNAEDEVDVTVGNGATSLTTIAGTLTMGSTAFVNNSGVVQVATQGTIDHDSLANFVAAEHYRWDTDISATATIHTNNITDLHGAGVDGSANQLLTDDGDGTVTSEANLTFDSSSGSLQMQHSGIPLLTLKRTSTGSDNDTVGTIRFTGNDDADNAIRYGVISAKIIDASDGAEEGQLNLAVASHDGEEVTGLSLTSGDAEDEIDASIANGTSSVTTVAGTLTMGSTATLDNSGNLLTNAATATALTSGDKTIEGNLRIGGSGDTSNNWISIDAQNGSDTTGGGITFYETGTYSVSAPQYGAKIVYNEDDDEFAIGTMHNNTFMRQIHMDRGSEQVIMQNIRLDTDSTNGPYVFFLKTDTSVADGDSLCRIIVRNSDRGSSTNNSQIQWFATEDHDSDSCGTKIAFTVTPNGNSQSETTAMTINQDSSLTVGGAITSGGNTVATTNLALDSFADSTSNSIGVGTIELGHAADTTIARSASGTVTIEGNTIVTTANSNLVFPSGTTDVPMTTFMLRKTLTTADMNSLHTTAVILHNGTGNANQLIMPIGGVIRVDRAATNTNSPGLNIHYGGVTASYGTTSIVHYRRFMNGVTTDAVFGIVPVAAVSNRHLSDLTSDLNNKLVISSDGAFTTDCFTSVDIFLTYQVITIA